MKKKTCDLFHLHARRHRLRAGSVPQVRWDPPLHPIDSSYLADDPGGQAKDRAVESRKRCCAPRTGYSRSRAGDGTSGDPLRAPMCPTNQNWTSPTDPTRLVQRSGSPLPVGRRCIPAHRPTYGNGLPPRCTSTTRCPGASPGKRGAFGAARPDHRLSDCFYLGNTP